jgi:hypothetical protein
MSGCGCNGATSPTKSAKDGVYTSADSNNIVWNEGSLLTGASFTIKALSRTIPLLGLTAPNILLFSENPCLAIGDKLQLTNIELASCMRGLTKCLAVTAAPVLVAGKWQVATDAVFSNVTGATTLDLTPVSASMFCDPSAASVSKNIEVKLCAGLPNPAAFTGYIYTRPLNTPASIGSVTLANGSTSISTKGNSSFNAKTGDLVTIDQTSPAFSATVLSVATGRNSSGERVSTYTLSAPVSGLTAVGANGTLPCVSATAKPQKIAPLSFSLECGCTIRVTLDKSLTSSPNFPQGTLSEHNGCTRQQYCFAIDGALPGTETTSYSGVITL